MGPLSRKLNIAYPKVSIEMENENYLSNHLLFIDDLKLFAKNDLILERIVKETENFFEVVGLEMNKAKSATSSEAAKISAVVLGAAEGYKYLGVTENRKSEVMQETYERKFK